MPEAWDHLLEIAATEVKRTVEALPPELRHKVILLPVAYESAPSEDWRRDGIEADTLGLFVGPEFSEQPSAVLPPHIILFLGNIWEMVDGDEKEFRFEVRTTYLHELGHYLGLNEIDLDERGLG
ncbi:MAG: metallopeptidase family protein [Opitutaceae bacterium]|nr:metallopeptidase family protein [Verrucomicrobiales bacterium]